MSRETSLERTLVSGLTAVTPALSKLRQENHGECGASLGYVVGFRSKEDPVKEGGRREREGRKKVEEKGSRMGEGRQRKGEKKGK